MEEMVQEGERWDMVIEAKNKFFYLGLRNVWRYRDLLLLMVKRDFVSFYKQTILGPIWFFIQPIFTTIIYTVVFGRLAGISTDGLPRPLFYLAGLTMWNYYAEALTKTSTVFRDNSGIFGKVYFPRLIMPLSLVVSGLIKFGIQTLLLLIVMAYYALKGGTSFSPSIYILLFPVLIMLMAAQALGFGMMVTAMTNKYRDLAFLLSFGIQLLMYATPVIYPLSSVPAPYRSILALNPMAQIIETARLGFLGQGDFTMAGFFYTIIISIVILLSGALIFNRVEKSFIDTV